MATVLRSPLIQRIWRADSRAAVHSQSWVNGPNPGFLAPVSTGMQGVPNPVLRTDSRVAILSQSLVFGPTPTPPTPVAFGMQQIANPLRDPRLNLTGLFAFSHGRVIPPPPTPHPFTYDLIPTILNLGQLQLQLNTLFGGIINQLPEVLTVLPDVADYADGKFVSIGSALYQAQSGSWVRLN